MQGGLPLDALLGLVPGLDGFVIGGLGVVCIFSIGGLVNHNYDRWGNEQLISYPES